MYLYYILVYNLVETRSPVCNHSLIQDIMYVKIFLRVSSENHKIDSKLYMLFHVPSYCTLIVPLFPCHSKKLNNV